MVCVHNVQLEGEMLVENERIVLLFFLHLLGRPIFVRKYVGCMMTCGLQLQFTGSTALEIFF